eukprot:5138096-Alexandrium_andersonii.AAC.1
MSGLAVASRTSAWRNWHASTKSSAPVLGAGISRGHLTPTGRPGHSRLGACRSTGSTASRPASSLWPSSLPTMD